MKMLVAVGKSASLMGLLTLMATAASAGPITVNNPSFETLPPGGLPIGCGTGCSFSEAAIPGWTNGGFSGQFIPGTQVGNFFAFNTIPDGITVAYSNGGTISQTVGATVQAGESILCKSTSAGEMTIRPFSALQTCWSTVISIFRPVLHRCKATFLTLQRLIRVSPPMWAIRSRSS